MTTDRMIELADEIVRDLDAAQAGEFAAILRGAIENAPYSTEQLQTIDAGLLANGVDVNPVCRKKHPTT